MSVSRPKAIILNYPWAGIGILLGLLLLALLMGAGDLNALSFAPLAVALAFIVLSMLAATTLGTVPATDPRVVLLLFTFFYIVLGPVGRHISYDLASHDVGSLALWISVMGVLGLLAAFLTWRRTEWDDLRISIPALKTGSIMGWVGSGVIILGYMFFYLNYSRVGGVLQAMSLPKVDLMMLLSSTPLNLPYTPFFAVGATLIVYGMLFDDGVRNNTRRAAAWWGAGLLLLLAPFLLLMGVEGERTTLLKIALPLAALICCRYRIALRPKIMALVVVAFVAASIGGNMRGALTRSLYLQTLTPVTERLLEFSPHWFFPREFAANYFSVRGTVEFDEEIIWGESYAAGFLAWLPRSLYPGEKPFSLADEFGERVAEKVGRSRRFGVGFSPLAEGYVNFGMIGPAVAMFLIGTLASAMALAIRSGGHFVKLLGFVNLPLMCFVFRAPFGSNVTFVFFNLFILAGGYFLWQLACVRPFRSRA